MNLLDAKVIQTQLEKEIFIDQTSNIELERFQYPNNGNPYFEFLVGLIMGRIRNKQFYGTEKVFFGIKIKEDIQSIIVADPEKESIFAAKNEQEIIAVLELIKYVLTESPPFKQVLKAIMSDKETPKVKSTLLEKVLNVHLNNIKFEDQNLITSK